MFRLFATYICRRAYINISCRALIFSRALLVQDGVAIPPVNKSAPHLRLECALSPRIPRVP